MENKGEYRETIAQAISELSEKASYRGDERILLKGIAQTSRKILKCDSCTVWLYDEDSGKLVLRGAAGRSEEGVDRYFYNRGEGLHGYIFEKKEVFNLTQTSDAAGIWKGKYIEELYPDRKDTGGPFLGVPIILEGKSLGVLSFASDDINYVFTNANSDFAIIIANQIAISLDNIKTNFEREILEKLERTKFVFLSEFSKKVLRCKTLRDIYELTTETTRKELNCRTSSLFLFSKEGKLERKYISGFKKYIPPPEIYQREQSFTGKTAGRPTEYGEPQICPDMNKASCVLDDPAVRQYIKYYEEAIEREYGFKEQATHLVTIPLNGNHRTFGVLRIINKLDPATNRLAKEGFTHLEQDWLLMVSNVVASAVANIKRRLRADSIISVNDLLLNIDERDIFFNLAKIITGETTSYSACVIRTLDEKGRHLVVAGSSGVTLSPKIYKLELDESFMGRTFCSGKLEIIKNLNDEPKDYMNVKWAKSNRLVSILCLPLKNIIGVPFGTISVYTRYEYIFDQVDLDYLKQFSRQVANVIQVIQEKKELRCINEISEQINQKSDIQEIFELAVRVIPSITGFDVCAIIKQQTNDNCVVASSYRGLIGERISSSFPIAIKMKKDPKIMIFPNVEQNIEFKDIRKFTRNIKIIVLVPIIIREEELYGTIVLAMRIYKIIKQKGRSRGWDTQLNENLYLALARLIETAVEKNKLIEKIQIESRRKDISNRIIREISSNEDLDNNLRTILDEIIAALRADIGYISLLSKVSNKIEPSFIYGIDQNDFPELRVGDQSLTSWVIEHRQTFLWPTGEGADKLYSCFKNLSREVKSEIIAPLVFSDEVIGLLTISSYSGDAFNDFDKDFVDSVAKETAVIIQNKRFLEAAERLAEVRFDTTDVEKNHKTLVEYADQILDNSITCLWIKKHIDDQDFLIMVSRHGVNIKSETNYDMPETERSISWQTVHSKEVNIIPSDLADPIHGFKHPEFIKENELESMISIPLMVGDEAIGVLNSYSRRSYRFLGKEEYLLKNLANKGAIAIRNAELTKQLNDINAKILDSAQLANPGHVAMSFSHDAKHTMHNMNALISSLIYLLPERIRESEEGKSVIESLTHDTDYLRKLLGSLVRYAKKAEIEYQPVKLMEILDYIYNIYSIRLERNRIECKIKFESKDLVNVEINCDRNQMEQVFLNLFNNAIYAIKEKMSKGGRIEIFIRNLGEATIEVQFKDNGSGIREEYLEKAFEPFFTTKGDRGSGFGLTICKRIIRDNHGGQIWIKSEFDMYGDYTVIFLKLPICGNKLSVSKYW